MNYMLKNENAIYYECGYSNDNVLYLSLGLENFLITDSRYTLAAQEGVWGNTMVITDRDLYGAASRLIRTKNIKKIFFDPKEWSVEGFEKISKKSKTHFAPKPDMSHLKRMIKTQEEIKKLSEAVTLGKNAFKTLAKRFSKYGIGQTEQQLANIAQSILRDFGELSFEPIVALNDNAAMPHAIPTDSPMKEGDLLLVDAGIKYQRYCSDRTRTVEVQEGLRLKKKNTFSQKKRQKVYDIVLKAHDVAIEKARSGMYAKEIDALARNVIVEAGFGNYFVHSTGHGVGLDIHEFPIVSAKSNHIIEDGMVFTIEPGIYLPKEFGIRIEDMVVMTQGRAKIL